MKLLEDGCYYKFSGLDFTTFRVCLPWNFMLREVMPRGPSKRAQVTRRRRVRKDRGWEMHTTLLTKQAPVESRNQGLDHERGWKQIHTSWFPMQWGTVPMFRLYLFCIFVGTLSIATRRHSGLLPASYMQKKKNEIRKHRALQTICPPNSYTTRQKTHCWIPAFTIVFPHKNWCFMNFNQTIKPTNCGSFI